MGLQLIMSDDRAVERNVMTPAKLLGLDTEVIIEQVWEDLHSLVDRSIIRQEVDQVIPRYASATITTFIPIFIHRETIKRLAAGSR